MQLKIAALLLASAGAVLAAEDDFSLPPASILQVLATAVPSSVAAELDNPSAISSWAAGVASSIENGQTPGWIASLPPSVKSYLYTAYVTDVAAVTSATGAATTGAGATTPATASATGAATTPAASKAASGTASGSTATSTGGAPAATGALAVGLAGAAGVLGLALAL